VHSNKYIYTFVLLLTAVVALALASLFTFLKPIHDTNEAIYNKKAILGAVSTKIDGDYNSLSDEQVQQIFDENIEQKVVDPKGNIIETDALQERSFGATKAEELDMAKEKKKPAEERSLPLYVYTAPDGEKYYIVTVRGNGLWDEIWGNIAFESDLNTIAGVSFDHKAETPGLGAEIKDNKAWYTQYIGKKIYDEGGDFESVNAIKGGAKDPTHEVDGISGATITADGVNAMLETGLKLYEPYFDKIKQS
jgi:Na+-transporting NADH:ubiquinone oxidoreductase subunit C